jgi:predicted esterase
VSWYEAAAFAEFAGKSLPTYYHWLGATDPYGPPSVLELSNFGGTGPTPVGRHQGLGPFGTYDMAGNVKEWCWNRSADKRYTLGGAWNDAVYLYQQGHAQPPLDRSEGYGFRCAKYLEPIAEALGAPIERVWRDYSREKPVDDATFRLFESIYGYDRTELKPNTQPLESRSAHWRLEKASFQAAYGNERVLVYLYLPESAAPPYQTVLYFPGSGAESVASHDWDLTNLLDFVIKSGRAVLVPVYNGLYERRFATELPDRAWRDLVIQWYKDLARSVDYLESRKDIDSQKLAFYGFSLGARMGVKFTALDKRVKASILLAGGLDSGEIPPEIDEINFLTRVKVPTLMLNGRDDFRFPLLVSQKPMFQLLGPREADKRHGLINGGHVPPKIEIIREVLDWLDRYLGPVAAPGS